MPPTLSVALSTGQRHGVGERHTKGEGGGGQEEKQGVACQCVVVVMFMHAHHCTSLLLGSSVLE